MADADGVVTSPRPPRPETRATDARLHDGTGMGMAWQMIIFIAGIIPAALSITGIIMWLRSRGWRAKLKRKRLARSSRSRCRPVMAKAPAFFETEADFRDWLAAHHERADELLVGFWKKSSGKPSIDWPQARDQALCFGWIDGVRKSIDEESYTIRFTPRRKGSIWSKVNVGRYEALRADGQMNPAGERAYEENKQRTGVYAYENVQKELSREETARFRRDKAAWPIGRSGPSHRKVVLHWITSAKAGNARASSRNPDRGQRRRRKIARADISRKKDDPERQAAGRPERDHPRGTDCGRGSTRIASG